MTFSPVEIIARYTFAGDSTETENIRDTIDRAIRE